MISRIINKISKLSGTQAAQVVSPFSSYDGRQYQVSEASPAFFTGVGRSGTHFLAKLYNQLDQVEAYHLDEVGNSTADSFWMYAQWYGLAIDDSSFLAARNYLIDIAGKNQASYFESNPYLAFCIPTLSQYYKKGKIVVTVRDPRKVVLSHLNKGWYQDYTPIFDNRFDAPGYQYNIEQPNHFFGRIVPKDQKELEKWQGMTQVGKISWMWKVINTAILEALSGLERDRWQMINIEKFDYQQYQKLGVFLELDDILEEGVFEKIRTERPGKTKKKKMAGWGKIEEKEFNDQTLTLWERLQQEVMK